MSNLTRRTFIKYSSVAGAALYLPTLRARGANDDIRLGFIGLGGRGQGSVKWFRKVPGTRIVALCEPDTERLNKVRSSCEKAGETVAHYTDVRKMLEKGGLDAVVISTTNHWHCLAAIWACQAGMDVYVEKPVSQNIWEGRQMVAAAAKYNRIVQGGTQQRSDPMQAELKAFLDSGELGEIKYVRCNRYGVRSSIGKRDAPLTPPETVDYDLWLGPAKDEPVYRNKFHYDWHWMWNTGNGEMGNWGPHIIDDMRNVVFRDRIPLPRRVVAGGGRFGWNDAGDTPNTHFVYFDTGSIPVVMDVHNLPRQKGVNAGDVYRRRRTGGFLVIECEGGYYAGGRGGGRAYDTAGEVVRKFKGDAGGQHAKNFIAAVRSRKNQDLNGGIEQAHLSSAWCHLGNVSWRLGRPYQREEAEAQLKDLPAWGEVIEDFHAHLKANELDIAKAAPRLGAMIDIDAEKQTLKGASATPEGLALIRPAYRKPFVVPEKV